MSINTYALVSLSAVKEFMGVVGSDSTMDDLLSNLINRYSTLFETEMGRNILIREYTEQHSGGGYAMLFTTQQPITSITSIHDSYEWVWDSDTLIDSDEYGISTGNYNHISFKSITLGNYVDNIQVVYTAGLSTVPEDIQQCMVEEVARSYKNRQEIGVTSKSLGDGSISYTAQGLLRKTEMVLSRYQRIVL